MTEIIRVPVRSHTRVLVREGIPSLQPDMFGDVPQGRQGDPAEGEARRREGKASSARRHTRVLAYAREIAWLKAREKGAITSDDVTEILESQGIELGNWVGSLFAGKDWQETGEWVRSRRPSAHARRLAVWRRVTP